MKHLIILIALFAWLGGTSQGIINRSPASTTVSDARLIAKLNLVIPLYTDTTAANLQKGLDSSGAIIKTYRPEAVWIRNVLPSKKWVMVGSGATTWQGTITAAGGDQLTEDNAVNVNYHSFVMNGAERFAFATYEQYATHGDGLKRGAEIQMVNGRVILSSGTGSSYSVGVELSVDNLGLAPIVSNTHFLGTPSYRWREMNARRANVDSLFLNGSYFNPTVNAGTVTNISVVSANGLSGTVSNPTSTPAITLSLGAITPTSVAASGAVSGSNLSGTNTGDETTARINALYGYTPANGSNYLPVLGGTITGTAGNGFINFIPQSSNPAAPTTGFKIFATSAGAFAWMTSLGYSREFRVRAQTQSNIWHLYDKSYTLADSADLATEVTARTAAVALKQNLITLTTTGSSGAATFNQSTGALNIPSYSGGGSTIGWFNIRTYGADTSASSTTNTTAINSAIAAAAYSNGTVYIPRGTYLVDSLVYNPMVTIIGDGWATSILKSNSAISLLSYTSNTVIYPVGRISDVGFDGNNVGTIGMNLYDAAYFKFERVRWTRFTQYGVHSKAILLGEFNNCYWNYCQYGIYSDYNPTSSPVTNYQSNLVVFNGCVWQDIPKVGLYWKNAAGIILNNPDFERTGTKGDTATGAIKTFNMSPNAEGPALSINAGWFERNYGVLVSIGEPNSLSTSSTTYIGNNTLMQFNDSCTYGVYVMGLSKLNTVIIDNSNIYNPFNYVTADVAANGSFARIKYGQSRINTVATTNSATANDIVSDAEISLVDETTKNSTTSRHGFLKKLPGSTSQILLGDGNWSTILSLSGAITSGGNVTAVSGGYLLFGSAGSGTGRFGALTNGNFVMSNTAQSGFGTLAFGSNTTLFPGYKLISFPQLGMEATLGDGTGSSAIKAGTFISGTKLADSNATRSQVIMDLNSTTRGVITPRMTNAQRDGIKGILSISVSGTNSTPYTGATFSTTGGGGSGAVIAGTVLTGNVTSFNVTSSGTGFTSTPTITPSVGAGQTFTPVMGTPEGTLIYSLDDHAFEYWNGTVWKQITTL